MSDSFYRCAPEPCAPTAAPNLQPRALYEALADRVRERILAHELRPGEPISETALMHEYGVSRTPVRETLKLLHHEGLLTARPRRGMSVRILGTQEREEAMRLHRLLQTHAAAHGVASEAQPCQSLLGRILGMTELHLRLAYGPAFNEQMCSEGAWHGRGAVASPS